MGSELIETLNASASTSPEIMTAASQRLSFLTADNPALLYSAIAEAVFSTDEIGLNSHGRLVGVIYLKNMMFDSREWHDADITARNSVKFRLFNFIFTGVNPRNMINEREFIPGLGAYVPELVARFVKNEWLRDNWDDTFWDKLLECCAWSCLKSSLKTAATFRLPSRRRAFLVVVSKLFPKITDLWCMQISQFSPENLTSCDKLTQLLVRCVLSWDKLDESMDVSARKLIDALCSNFKTLLSSIMYCSSKEDSFKFTRHLAKLLFVLIVSISAESRSLCATHVLDLVFFFLKGYPQEIAAFDRSGIKWILALLCGFICSRSQFNLTLSEEGANQIQQWLSRPCTNALGHQSGTQLSCLLECIVNQFFVVESQEVENVILHPEECLTTGGFCSSTGKQDDKGGSSNALALWNTEVQAREALNSELRTLAALAKQDNPILSGNSCRQLSEFLVLLLARSYKDDVQALLYNMIQSNFSQPETAMRLAQLCLPYFGADSNYQQLTERLLSNCLDLTNSLSDSLDLASNVESVFIITRFLCLLTRHAAYCSQFPTGDCETDHSESRYKTALDCLVRFLARPSDWNSKQQSTSNPRLAIRLAAATSLAWFVDQPTFPGSVLIGHLEQLICGMLALMQDVSECETKIYLLSTLRDLVEAGGFILYPELNNTLLTVLDQLWQLDDPSPVLKTNILDLICLVLTNLNSSPESLHELADFTTNLQIPVASLVHLSLTDPSSSMSYALFEPALRLWASMVEGEGSRWSPALENLIPLLANTESSTDAHSVANPRAALVARLDSAEQAELVFRIAQGTLRLASQAGPTCLDTFLAQCTQPFWNSVLVASSDLGPALNRARITDQTNLESLYSQASQSDTDSGSDEESKYRLTQLNLFTIWLSVYLDRLLTNPTTDSPTLTPSLIGLLILATKSALQAPLEPHNDISPRATQFRLGFLARLAIYPSMWPFLLHILSLLKSNQSSSINLQSATLTLLSTTSASPLPSDPTTLQTLIDPLIDRWLARADSAPESVDRRCLAVASLVALGHISPSRCEPPVQPTESQLNQMAVSDQIHAKWFEPIMNLVVQVLHEDDPDPSVDLNVNFYRSMPRDLASTSNLKNRLLVELTRWQSHVGGPVIADALLKCHIDPALRKQLEHCLNSH